MFYVHAEQSQISPGPDETKLTQPNKKTRKMIQRPRKTPPHPAIESDIITTLLLNYYTPVASLCLCQTVSSRFYLDSQICII